jgi:hypothetical protein
MTRIQLVAPPTRSAGARAGCSTWAAGVAERIPRHRDRD